MRRCGCILEIPLTRNLLPNKPKLRFSFGTQQNRKHASTSRHGRSLIFSEMVSWDVLLVRPWCAQVSKSWVCWKHYYFFTQILFSVDNPMPHLSSKLCMYAPLCLSSLYFFYQRIGQQDESLCWGFIKCDSIYLFETSASKLQTVPIDSCNVTMMARQHPFQCHSTCFIFIIASDKDITSTDGKPETAFWSKNYQRYEDNLFTRWSHCTTKETTKW